MDAATVSAEAIRRDIRDLRSKCVLAGTLAPRARMGH
jgi:hypothetical protein